MAEHLTMVSLRRALSARAGVSEKVADDFLSALTGCIQEGLQQDGKVSVNGLGTFSTQDVPARESVNVATGERFTIEGYKKVVFAAGSGKPRAKSQESAISNDIDPIQKLGEQAEEIKDILGELSAMSAEPAEHTEATPIPVAVPIEVPVEVPAETIKSTEVTEPMEEKEEKKKPFNPWLTGLITIGVFAMLLVIAYFILRHKIVNWADGMRTSIEQRVGDEPAVSNQQPTVTLPEVTETTEAPETTEVPAQPLSPWFDDSQRKFTEFLPTETVAQDSRLAWIAKKRYGEKAYWVFIYEVNRDRLKSPDYVLPGAMLRIPKLPKELSNPNDPDVKALLERLSDKYLGGKR
ncbi:MAG: HU family DNA-binding protein [Paludibacteraceae bacterium]|nr:HU family DNA-binding protein [Paludibacteraceae bacterium]